VVAVTWWSCDVVVVQLLSAAIIARKLEINLKKTPHWVALPLLHCDVAASLLLWSS